jgi:hypothetical protein
VIINEDLRKWVAEKWVDIGAPKKGGGFKPCGRQKGEKRKGYPKCVPLAKANSMSTSQRRSAVKRKRAAGNTGPKPTNVATFKKKNIQEACWKGYKTKGMKKKNGRMVPNCVPMTESYINTFLLIMEATPAWQRSEGKDPKGGLNRKGIASYRAANPGSKLSMAVTTKPSKLKKGSKAANRRKSFCARMGGMKKRLTSAKTANDPNSRINKALRKWNC